jgi:hypothetical protein
MKSFLHASPRKQCSAVLKMVASSSGVSLSKEKFSISLLGTRNESATFLLKETYLLVDPTIAQSELGTFRYHLFDIERAA